MLKSSSEFLHLVEQKLRKSLYKEEKLGISRQSIYLFYGYHHVSGTNTNVATTISYIKGEKYTEI